MSRVDMQLANVLTKEIIDWVGSGRLLTGFSGSGDDLSYVYDDRVIPLTLKSLSDWLWTTDINHEETAFVELLEMISDTETSCNTLNQYSSQSLDDLATHQTEFISREVNQSSAVESLARVFFDVRQTERRKYDDDWLWSKTIDHLCTTITGHLCAIVKARTVTLSTRYAPTEAIFKAYKLGLLPFGWDWDSLWCLDPGPLLRSQEKDKEFGK